MKSTFCRTYFKCIRRDLDSTFALGLSHSLALTESEYDKHPSVNLINWIVDDQDQERSFSFQPVTVQYVLDLLLDLKRPKATGMDHIAPTLLTALTLVLATPLTRLWNSCLKQSCWISEWKSSNISPVFKRGCEATKVPSQSYPVYLRFSNEWCITNCTTTLFHAVYSPTVWLA